jgi:hypothetical protein
MFVLSCILTTTEPDEGVEYDTEDRFERFMSLPRMFILLVLFLCSAKHKFLSQCIQLCGRNEA